MANTNTNYPSFDSIPRPSPWTPVLIQSAHATSQTSPQTGPLNVIDPDENTKWASVGIGESLVLQLSHRVRLKRIDIEWDPTLPRTGQFEIGTTVDGFPQPTSSETYTMNSMLWSSAEYDPDVSATVITIICFGNIDDDKNGITHVKIYQNT